MVTSINHLGNYRDLLQRFKDSAYTFNFFGEQSASHGEIILRHDIDFDTHMALRMAQIETDLGIKSTYFFLLRSNLYNIFSRALFNNVSIIVPSTKS